MTQEQLDDLNEVRLAVLRTFAAAFTAHDLDTLMSHMSDDCVFYSSGGDLVEGAIFEGSGDVAAAFRSFWERMPDAAWHDDYHAVAGDRGVSHWRFHGTTADGSIIETWGCDLFEFSGTKIRVKDSYRKHRPPQRPPG